MAVKDVILTIGDHARRGARLSARGGPAAAFRGCSSCSLAGALLGPSVSDAIDVQLDSIGAQLLLTLGVSFILFHGGLQLSTRVLEQVAVGLGLLVVPGVVLTALVAGLVAAAVFGVPLTSGLLIGAVLAPTDPAILIPLFERMRLRPKVVADDHRRVGAQRSDRRGARARRSRVSC